MTENGRPRDPLSRLDAVLARTLLPPAVPRTLRARVEAAVAQTKEADFPASRRHLELEARKQLAELEAQYVRLRRRTLGTVIGAAFAAGAVAAWFMPYLTAQLGRAAPLVLALGGTIAGLAIAAAVVRNRADIVDLLRP
jgi:hypothetical protein